MTTPLTPCSRYFGSDGTLCATHHGRFLSDTSARCDNADRERRERVDPDPDKRALVFSILHDEQCDDATPHPYTDHMPWDEDDDGEAANRLADRLVAALSGERVDPDLRAVRALAGLRIHHSGSCCVHPPPDYKVTVTPESCKCEPANRAVHDVLGMWGTVAEQDAIRARLAATPDHTVVGEERGA